MIRDEVETAKPAIITSLIHADDLIKAEGDRRFFINRNGTKLWIDLIEPKELKSAIEVNTVTAPGPPGAVDKGERQERGQKLLISTRSPVRTATLVLRLKVATQATSQSR
jgi:hypothetical protein